MSLERLRRFARAHPRETTAFLIYVILAAVVMIRSGLQPHRADTYRFYRDAGLNWRHGRELYQEIGETCRYSPLVHALVAPLTTMPDWLGGTVWRLMNSVSFLTALFFCGRVLWPGTWSDGWRAFVVLSTIPLAIGSLDNAQSNPLMTAGLLAGVTALALRRWNLAAAGLALAFLLKVYPISLVLLLILLYPRQLAPRFVAWAAAGLLLPFACQDASYVARQYGNWLVNLQVDDRSQIDLSRAYRDLWMLIRLTRLPISLTAYHGIQLAGAALAAGLVQLLGRRGVAEPERLNFTLALGACWMMLLGPATESSTYIVLAPSLGWALALVANRPSSTLVRAMVWASFAMFVTARLAGLIPGATAQLHALGPHPLGGLLLTLALATLVLRTRPARAEMGKMTSMGQAA